MMQINLAHLHPIGLSALKAAKNISIILSVIADLSCYSPLCGFLLCPVNTAYMYVE